MKLHVVGIDLGKTIFHLVGVDSTGKDPLPSKQRVGSSHLPLDVEVSQGILPLSVDNLVCPNCRQETRLCQLLCPPNRRMGTRAHSQPHARITAKLFCFSRNVENRTVVFGSAPALGAGGLRFKSGRPDQSSQWVSNSAHYCTRSTVVTFVVTL